MILKATQFPYIIESEDLTLQGKIIRDADLSQLFEPTRIQMNLLGLAKELDVNFLSLLEGQKIFVNEVKFYGVKGYQNYNKLKQEILDEIDILIKMN